ncbi:MAG: hypothetical protein HY098_05790 [Nitrospinae bacterium]|nr:hypothetical protein [Nitrospinota bacterium]
MSRTDDAVESFLAFAGGLGKKFVLLAFEMTNDRSPQSVVAGAFRGVHSLAGEASVIAEDEPRFYNLGEFCGDFETFLDGLRNGRTELNPRNRAVAANALYALHDDIEKLQNGGTTDRRGDMLADFKGEQAGAVVVGGRGNALTFEIRKNLLRPGDVADFNKILWKYLRVCPLDAMVVFDLFWESRLSIFAVGCIVGALGGAAKIAVIRPPDDMYLVFKSHRFEEFGIPVRNSLEECWP